LIPVTAILEWVRGGIYEGIGIMGQSLLIVPEEELVIV
jgi:hypothetical protein